MWGRLLLCVLFYAAMPWPVTGWGQAYPARPVRIIVGFGAGGPDTTARIIAQQLAIQMGQPFVVDNRPGANGIIGTEMVVKGTADGGAGSACLGFTKLGLNVVGSPSAEFRLFVATAIKRVASSALRSSRRSCLRILPDAGPAKS